jgi:hypothetical protein
MRVKGSRAHADICCVNPRSAASALALLAISLAGCGGGSSIRPKEVGPCQPGNQISGTQLRAALRRQGFSAVCFRGSGKGVANATATGQGDKAGHEGTVICQVSSSMPPKTARHPHKVFEWSSLPTHSQPGRQLMLANIDCSLYLDPGTRRDAPVRIRKAFNALAARRF